MRLFTSQCIDNYCSLRMGIPTQRVYRHSMSVGIFPRAMRLFTSQCSDNYCSFNCSLLFPDEITDEMKSCR